MTNLKPHDTLFWATVVDDLKRHQGHDTIYTEACVICQFERENGKIVALEDSPDGPVER